MKRKLKVILVHISIWLALITFPLILNGQALANIRPGNNSFVYGPFFFINVLMIGIFYLNYFLFIPRFLFKKQYITYFLICGLTFILINELPRIGMLIERRRPPMPFPMSREDMERGRNILMILHTNSFLMYAAVFTASIALRMNNLLNTMEKEKYAAQLSYLKSQVNPHFLFNTLNSIYAVSLKTAPQAADMVSHLSEMMRYNMREAQMDRVSLRKELDNLTNYVELQKVRIHNKVKLRYVVNGKVENQEIAPLLLLPFVENAFKHGVSPEQDSIVFIEITVDTSVLRLLVRNTKVHLPEQHGEGGLGIENTVNRLDLIYPGRHLLSIDDRNDTYSVSLEITLI